MNAYMHMEGSGLVRRLKSCCKSCWNQLVDHCACAWGVVTCWKLASLTRSKRVTADAWCFVYASFPSLEDLTRMCIRVGKWRIPPVLQSTSIYRIYRSSDIMLYSGFQTTLPECTPEYPAPLSPAYPVRSAVPAGQVEVINSRSNWQPYHIQKSKHWPGYRST